MVRQHHSTGAEVDAVRVCSHVGDQHAVAEEAIDAMLWCSAYQIRR